MLLAKLGQDAGEQIFRDRIGRRKADRTGAGVAAADAAFQRRDVVAQAQRQSLHIRTRGREAQAGRGALEQPRAQPPLDLPQPPRQRRMADAQTRRGARQRAVLGDSEHDTQVVPVQGR